MGYNYLKIHSAIVIVATWLCGYFVDKSVPYFPIEISRTGTGKYSHSIFAWGLFSLIVTLWWEGAFQYFTLPLNTKILTSPALIWPFVVLVAWFPDHTHMHLHNFFVACGVLISILNVCLVGDFTTRFPVVVFAMGLNWMLVLFKGGVVLFTELENSMFDWRVYYKAVFNVGGLRDEVVKRIFDIMYETAEYAAHPEITIPVFRVTGIFQWMVFYLLLCLY